MKNQHIRKMLALALTITLLLVTLAACQSTTPDGTASPGDVTDGEPVTLVVGATSVPHAEILNQVKAILEAQGVTLDIREFADYQQLNPALSNGDLDANYFQHRPYLDDFNQKNGTSLIPVADIHYEPFGIFPGRTTSLDALPDKAKVAVPNDTTNEARALNLLAAEGLIKLKEGAGLEATVLDITENPKNLEIIELEAAQIPRSLPDVDIAVINGNYALEAGLNAESDALAVEAKDSLAADTFANVVVVRPEDESNPGIQALIKALQSDEIRSYINDTYQGAVVPKF